MHSLYFLLYIYSPDFFIINYQFRSLYPFLFISLCFLLQSCFLSTFLFFFILPLSCFVQSDPKLVATRVHKIYFLHYTNTWIIASMIYTYFCQNPVYLFSSFLPYVWHFRFSYFSFLFSSFFYFLQVCFCYLLFLIFASINRLSGLVSRKDLEAFPLWRRFNSRDFHILPKKLFELLEIPIEGKGVRCFRNGSLFPPLFQ